MSPEAFARSVLRDGLSARRVVVGQNFRFGHRRSGDLQVLSQLGKDLGFEALAEALIGDSEGAYSSTRVRDALGEGDLASVTGILGRPHALTGVVVSGDRRGRQLGFPTANLAKVHDVLPRRGVYAVAVDIETQARFEQLGVGALNVGVRPTVEAGPSTEVHLLDLDADLYEKTLRVHLIGRLRDEQRFAGLEALKQQLALDIENTRKMLTGLAPDPRASPAWF